MATVASFKELSIPCHEYVKAIGEVNKITEFTTAKETENMLALKRNAETSNTVMVIRFQMKWS